MRRLALILPLAGLLAACEGGGDPVMQALREEAANNHAEAALAREAQAQHRAARAEAAQAEIEQLRREIAVAEAALEASEDPQIRASAQETIAANRLALQRLDAEG